MSNALRNPEARAQLFVLLLIITATLCAALRPELITHFSLGCTLRRFTGIRCPFCGMTTDFITLLHGHLPRENPFSIPFAAIIYLVYPAVLFYTIRTGKLHWFSSRKLQITTFAVVCVMWAANNIGNLGK